MSRACAASRDRRDGLRVALGLLLLAVGLASGRARAAEPRSALVFPPRADHNHAPGIAECPNGDLLGKHRKLKPTGSERLIWGEGDGRTLTVIETPLGKIGGLICWENYMPLARMAMYQKGVQIYLAPTADARDTWLATLRHIACEGRCFVLGCNQYVTKEMYPADLQQELAGQPEVMCRGGSAIVSPLGEVLAGPLYDREEILWAELNLAEVVQGKYDFDVAGHYHRPDVFQFNVNE